MFDSVHYDRAGFPMIWLSELNAHVHWLPVTKIQFEYFLCDAPDAHFDASWYDRALQRNPRVTPRDVNHSNYYRALMTGIRPEEAQRFAGWCGDGFRLPTESEWTKLHRWASSHPSERVELEEQLSKLPRRIGELLRRIDNSVHDVCDQADEQTSLAIQMLLRFGAAEWVRTGAPPLTWGFKGEPLPKFCGNLANLERPAEALAISPHRIQLAAAGFRLLYRPSREEV